MSAPEIRGISAVVLPMIGLRSSKRSYVVALVCYLDDSGTDPQCPYVVMAGYLTTLDSWQIFEAEAAKVMARYHVTYIRGRDLWASDGEYADQEYWTFDRKLQFLIDLNAVLSPNIGIAVTFACLKSVWEERAKVRPIRKQSAFGFCFEMLFHALLKDQQFMNVVTVPGVNLSWVIEQGNQHNDEIVQRYQRLLIDHGERVPFFAGMALAPKNSTIAIQMADLLAFFSRRQVEAMEKNNRQPVVEHPFMAAIMANVRPISRASTDFGVDDSVEAARR